MIHQDPVPEEERSDSTVVVVADVDVISDQIAFQRNFLGLTLAANDNHKLLLNAVDYLLGAQELMGIRAKHAVRRPFTLFDDIEAEAELQTLERERQLREEVAAAEEELRQKRQEMSGQEAALFQKKVQEEVDRINDRLAEANRELREIRKDRREALERQESRVRFSVLGWMPTLVLAVGIFFGLRRRRMHRQVTGVTDEQDQSQSFGGRGGAVSVVRPDLSPECRSGGSVSARPVVSRQSQSGRRGHDRGVQGRRERDAATSGGSFPGG